MTKQFVMLAGPPCSGKSTFAESFDGFVKISTDEYIEKFAKDNGKIYHEVFESCFSAAVDNMMDNLYAAIDEGKNILWDQTNLSRAARMKKLKSIPKDYFKFIVYMDTGYGTLITRNQERFQKTGKLVPDSVLQRMSVQAEIPTEDEGWDCVEIVIQE